MIEYSLILFIIFKSLTNTNTKKITNNEINKISEKQLIINEINDYDINYDTILDNIKKLLAFYNYEGHLLISRIKNDLIRDKKNKLNKKMVEKIKVLNNNILINQEIKKINRDMIIYKSNIEYVFKKLRNDIYLDVK
jgi:hypothetical protein